MQTWDHLEFSGKLANPALKGTEANFKFQQHDDSRNDFTRMIIISKISSQVLVVLQKSRMGFAALVLA